MSGQGIDFPLAPGILEEQIRGLYGLDLYLGLPEILESRYVEMFPWLPMLQQQAALEVNRPDPRSLPGIAINLNAIPAATFLCSDL